MGQLSKQTTTKKDFEYEEGQLHSTFPFGEAREEEGKADSDEGTAIP